MDRSTLIGLINFLPIAAAIAEDGDCRKITVNRVMAEIMRTVYSENLPESASFTSTPFYKAYHNGEPMQEADFPLRQAVLKGIEIKDYEMDIARPDGSTATVLAYATPWREDGQITGGYAVYQDIGLIRRMQTEMESLRYRMNEAIEEKLSVEHELAQQHP